MATHGDDDQETVSTTSSGYGSNTTQKGEDSVHSANANFVVSGLFSI